MGGDRGVDMWQTSLAGTGTQDHCIEDQSLLYMGRTLKPLHHQCHVLIINGVRLMFSYERIYLKAFLTSLPISVACAMSSFRITTVSVSMVALDVFPASAGGTSQPPVVLSVAGKEAKLIPISCWKTLLLQI
ncbi:hypothetical protein CHARACLAT_014025 [Characodon lateralis]|uniref:Uncharacterized protein n=1 Tax=Characodon lateralis TaxID=208331 RepID=A0ABU7DSK0_9TELE|nr:hypothetical protein [Characodon lateralis]